MARRKRKKLTIGVQDATAPVKQVLWLVFLPILFFLTMCFSVNTTLKVTALVIICITLLGGILCFSVFRQRIKLPLIVLLLMVLMGGISTAYALSGKFALYEFLKLVVSLCSGLLLMMLTPGEGAGPGRRIATVLEGSAALTGLFSVDLISTRFLSTPLLSILGKYDTLYVDMPGVEEGVRLTSIFQNPNVFAGCVGIGVLLSLSLVLSSAGKKERCVHLCCLYVNSVSFVLAFSMGATAAIAVAFLIYLLLERKSQRGSLLVLMLETLVLTAISIVVCSAVAFDRWDGIQPLPLLCLVAGSVLLCLVDQVFGQKLGGVLQQRGKLILIVIAGVLVLAIVFSLAAYHVTGGLTLNSGDALRRAAYPEPGEYTLKAEGSGNVIVSIETQNHYETMMHTSTVLYRGALSDALFVVPEDSLVVYFNFAANESVELTSVQYVGENGSGEVPLEYKLLPDFIANRLQGLFANQNAIQRTVFFEDGVKLFQDSPVVGVGLGGFENAIHRVQGFFYETKYVHNHYIQTLLETGIIGFVLFVGLLVLSAVCILRARKKEAFHPLTPALGALLAFMAVHAATEVVFSSYPYLPLAFGVFVLINLCCGDAIPTPWLEKKSQIAVAAGAAVLLVFFTVLLCNNMIASRMTDKKATFNAFSRAVSMDKFEWADYALSYVMGSLNGEVSEAVAVQAAEYAERLAQENSNGIPLYLTKYYLETGNVEKGMEMALKYASYLSSSEDAWNELLHTLDGYENLKQEVAYIDGITRLADLLDRWQKENLGKIQLDQAAKRFLESVLQ